MRSGVSPDITAIRGRDTGKTALVVMEDRSAYNPASTLKVVLTYPEFRWALERSLKAGEPILDLKDAILSQIKKDYARVHRGWPHH